MNILYLPPIAYREMKQRPQYLAEELAKKHDVTYVDPTVSTMKYLLKGGDRPGGYQFEVSERLKVIRLDGQWSVHRSLEGLWSGWGDPERRQLKPLLQQAKLVWIGHASWFDLLREYPGRILYDKMDDEILLTKNKLLQRLLRRVEPELIRRADIIVTTAQCFYETIRAVGNAPILLPNAVDRTDALRYREPAFPKKAGRRVFGYVGMISHWFDMRAIQVILDEDEQNEVILVGPTEIPRLEHERLTYVGRVPKEQVGAWIAAFDVCLYPFRCSALLDTINPVKLYEYLAANKPVLAVRSRETSVFSHYITIYEDLNNLARKLAAKAFFVPFAEEKERLAFVEENSWVRRGEVLLELLQKDSSALPE